MDLAGFKRKKKGHEVGQGNGPLYFTRPQNTVDCNNPKCSQGVVTLCAHCLNMYLGICEKENHIFVFHTSHLVQLP